MNRILMLTPQLPYPPHQGTSLRNLHILRALAQHHHVTLLSFAEPDRLQELEPLLSFCDVLPPIVIPSRSAANRFRQLISTSEPDVALRLQSEAFMVALTEAMRADVYDAVQIEGIELARYIRVIQQLRPGLRIVFDCHNAETELQRRSLGADLRQPKRWPAAIYSGFQIGRLARFERWAVNTADSVIAVSDTDRAHLRNLLGKEEKKITVIPNTIDITEYGWTEAITPEFHFDLVFSGKMDYRPNVDGVLWFAKSVWPQIRHRRPGTTWAIIGQRPHSRLEPLRDIEGISLTGRVRNIQPYLAGASVYIIPLRIGSGTRLKLIEAMASGKPVVSTTLGAEGFEVVSQENILLADSPLEWEEALLGLLDNPARQGELGAGARKFAARYDWRRIIPLLDAVYSKAAREG